VHLCSSGTRVQSSQRERSLRGSKTQLKEANSNTAMPCRKRTSRNRSVFAYLGRQTVESPDRGMCVALQENGGFQIEVVGVGDGNRTHNVRSHSPVLCQLSYTHRIEEGIRPIITGGFSWIGCGGTQPSACSLLRRRIPKWVTCFVRWQLLFVRSPAELWRRCR
jgi:hypothetical protein